MIAGLTNLLIILEAILCYNVLGWEADITITLALHLTSCLFNSLGFYPLSIVSNGL